MNRLETQPRVSGHQINLAGERWVTQARRRQYDSTGNLEFLIFIMTDLSF